MFIVRRSGWDLYNAGIRGGFSALGSFGGGTQGRRVLPREAGSGRVWSASRGFRVSAAKMVQHKITSMDEFKTVINSENLVVIDFFAVWCFPCRTIKPIVEVESEKPENSKVGFYVVDVDELQDVAQVSNVSSMPTFQFFKKGEMLAEVIGADPQKLLSEISRLR